MPERYRLPTREQIAMAEVGRTAITRPVAAALTAVFLATIVAVPAVQQAADLRAWLAGRRLSPWPAAADAVRLVPRAAEAAAAPGTPAHRIFQANRLLRDAFRRCEQMLEDESLLAAALIPPVQYVMTEWLGTGNEDACVGLGGWLFYRRDVEYAAGPGFLQPGALRTGYGRQDDLAPPRGDPRRAVIDLRDQLAARGIALVVVPTPVKPTVHPERLSRRLAGAGMVENPSFGQFKADLERAGVLVFDPSEVLGQARLAGRPLYLKTDTHWRPEAVEAVAQALADFLRSRVGVSAGPVAEYQREEAAVTNLGDVAVMLRMPAAWGRAAAETVAVHPVVAPDGTLWRPVRSAEVLLLGDSFSNIYSLGAMGWGESAGLAEQLSLALRRPVDAIVRNDAGASATRLALARDMARGIDRLAEKRVVVWQFAARELAQGDWQPVRLVLAKVARGGFYVPPPGQVRMVTGTVADVSAVPRPGRAPYKDHIMAVHLTDLADEKGPVEAADAVVYTWSMRNSALTPCARLKPGDRVAFRLASWADVAARYDSVSRSELEDEQTALEPPCWGELVSR